MNIFLDLDSPIPHILGLFLMIFQNFAQKQVGINILHSRIPLFFRLCSISQCKELLSELINQQIIEGFKLRRIPSCTWRPVATIIQLEYQWNKQEFLFWEESVIKQGFQCIQWIGKLRYKIHKTITQRTFCDGFHFNYFTIHAK